MLPYVSRLHKTIFHLALLIGILISIFPFYWMLVMATNTTSAMHHVPPRLTFGDQLWKNITDVFLHMDFFRYFFNTTFVAGSTTLLVLLFCSLAGFTFAQYTFPYKNALFITLLITMILPTTSSPVASFLLMVNLGWMGTFLPLIVPGMIPAFGIFWMRQYALSAIPGDLIDAVRIDGGGYWRQYWHIALPMMRPALGFLAIFTFITTWNEYLWPLIVLTEPGLYTLQVALAQFTGIYHTEYSMLMAGICLSTLPLIIIFVGGARQFIANISAGALKT